MVESSSDEILKEADKVDVAFLVVGDPFGYVILVSCMARLIVQGHNPYRPRSASQRIVSSSSVNPKCLHLERYRQHRSPTL